MKMSDYVVNGILIEVAKPDEERKQRERLLTYYKMLLKVNEYSLDEKQKKALETVVKNMTEEAAEQKAGIIDESTAFRLLTYYNALKNMNESQKDEVKKIAEGLWEVIDATVEDGEYKSVVVNGNKFLYEEGSVDVGKYADKLYEIGQNAKGNTWTIYTDEEGELVIY